MKHQNKPRARGHKLAKHSRLKSKKDFHFAKFKRFKTDLFCFVYTWDGKGRLGISLSKKILSSAVARNRVKRLIREVFRNHLESFSTLDLNVLGAQGLTKGWKSLEYTDVSQQFENFLNYLKGPIGK